MIHALALLASSNSAIDAQALIAEVEKHYRALSSFSMDIEHHDSSGLYPGDYKQTLRWQKGKKFDLLVTKASNHVPKEGVPGGLSANFYSNGAEVIGIKPDGGRSTFTVAPDENTMPGWEVSGGFILSWLMDTPVGKFLSQPPKGLQLKLGDGSATIWRETPVREVTIAIKNEGSGEQGVANLYIHNSKPTLIGFRFTAGKQNGWAHYSNQVENPKFDKPIGDPPQLSANRL